ncbi:CENP-X/MHF2 family protein [Aspergillus neoniger CBS 115656]|uniref:CENP-S associating centromere protein X-domain-containing protein n=1 Tax=Aspergillus neoniger (strain CBS 115656) TaxID=1448310 RepID=A0A318YGI7_ASPNB|nr:hypothetical protein BO87DRAFT_377316 [Aspergillus neoniger CBS 115656]PYH33611.1 hypothetical protein BO87DRAFT_377316 [Aspergillus neoniger CBS 115656]
MPPERKPAQKRRQLPFKPPSRTSSTAAPASSSSTTSKPKAKATTKSTTAAAASKRGPKPKEAPAKASSSKSARPRPSSPSPADSEEDSDNDNDNDNASSSPARSDASSPEPEPEPDYILAEIIHKDQPSDDVLTNDPVIPPKLLTRLLHHHFQNEKTKIAKDANTVVAKYVDVFVREALARAAFERSEAVGKGASVGDGFLEVEDLEKMAPQLVMDF